MGDELNDMAPLVKEAARLVRRERLWVPLLSHFDAQGRIDLDRTAAQVRSLRDALSGFLLAGSTGDGWAASDDQFQQILALLTEADLFDAKSLVLVGCLRPTTDEVVARAAKVEGALKSAAPTGRFAGLAVCPPVDASSQSAIAAHYQRVFDATESPVAVYQLPQVTRCEIAPATMQTLLASGRVHMFKDTSGEDRVAASGVLNESTWSLRGAEGRYDEAVGPAGLYDGLLLSTANGLAPQLRDIVDRRLDDDARAALSERLSEAVAEIFRLAESSGSANPFADANRAIDHVQAYGERALATPLPRRVDGTQLAERFVRDVREAMQTHDLLAATGYLAG